MQSWVLIRRLSSRYISWSCPQQQFRIMDLLFNTIHRQTLHDSRHRNLPSYSAWPVENTSDSLVSSVPSISVLSTSTSLALNSASFASTSMSFATSGDTVSNIMGPPSYTSQPTNRSNTSLDSGAKAGIVAGAVTAGLLVFTCILFLVERSKRRKRILDGPDHATDQSANMFTGGKAELDPRTGAELNGRV